MTRRRWGRDPVVVAGRVVYPLDDPRRSDELPEDYMGLVQRAPALLLDGKPPQGLCAALRAVLEPVEDVDTKDASSILALVQALWLAAPDDREAASALAPALCLAAKVTGSASVKACADPPTVAALLRVFDAKAARALTVLLRGWRKQRLTQLPLNDLLKTALDHTAQEPPDSQNTVHFLTLAATVIAAAPSPALATDDPALAELLMTTLERVLQVGATDANTDRKAIAQARLLLDLVGDFRPTH